MTTHPEATWADLAAEAADFEAWYLPSRLGVNAWVGVDAFSGFYGGWSVEGDQLYYDWDEPDATGGTPGEVRADLIRIARHYRERTDELNAEPDHGVKP